MRTKFLASVAAAGLLGSTAGAAPAPRPISCNGAMDIECEHAHCTVADASFVAMAASVKGSRIEFCGGERCATGPLDLYRVRGTVTIAHGVVEGEHVTLAVDRKRKIGTLLWSSRTVPVTCA
jgi:hypothetical protein